MITAEDYFRDSVENYGYTPTDDDLAQAIDLLERVEKMEQDYVEETGNEVFILSSGHRTREKTLELQKNGYRAALGGNHEKSAAVDIRDKKGYLDAWLDDEKLASYGLYREDPRDTAGWTHVQNVP